VVIRASRGSEIARLIISLRDGSAVAREAAVARLRVIGARAVDKIALLLRGSVPPGVRVAALNALDGIDDRRIVDLAIAALADADADVAAGAAAVLRGWVAREEDTRVIDALTTVALDTARVPRVRHAALDALSDLPQGLLQPVLDQAKLSTVWVQMDDPAAAREWLTTHPDASLSELHDLIVHARDAAKQEPASRPVQEWLAVRGAAHAVLARRGSRVAIYDLREAFDDARGPLPLDFLAAATIVGDASCLEPMARAWAASPVQETWWRERLADSAAEIMHRTRLSGRSNIAKRIRTKWPGFM
jgi:hypothetical protein